MQINPFGFPLGAGMQSASASGDTGLGFIDALGLASGGVAPQLTALKASATPPAHFGPKLAQTLFEQAQLAAQVLPKTASGILPGLQQPTSLSELMATAAKLPGADQLPVATPAAAAIEPALPVAVDTAAFETPITAPPVAAETDVAAAPAAKTVEIAAPEITVPSGPAPAVPTQADAELQSEADALPNAPATAAPAETAPSKPQKGPRDPAAEADPLPSSDTQPAIPAEMLVINAVPQPITPQQSAPRESANAQSGPAGSKVGKVVAQAAPGHDAVQSAPGTGTGTGTGTADFARAVAAKAESAGSESNPDGQPQPETIFAPAAKADAAAPILPQHAHSATSVDHARATAPAAPAEPMIEARAGHLGQSLGVEIARKVELGEETLRIRLNPIELGRIEVTLAFDDKGSLQATVRTESAQAMDLLRQDAPDLARTLDQAGVRTDAQSFRFENRSGDGSGQQAQQQNQHSNRGQSASSDDDATAEPIYRPIRSDGQVDLLA
jgi:flagellar hook-length control protein FliK